MHTKNSKGIVDTEGNKRVGIGDGGMEHGLLNIIKRRKLSYFGHVMRKEGDCLEKEFMQGTTPGARKQGKPRMRRMDNTEEWTGIPFEDLLKKTRDRREWSRLVHEATNPQIEDG